MQTNKLREACANIVDYVQSAMCHATDAHVLDYLLQVEMWARAALAEPVKNCEVGTAREQSARFNKFCYDHRSYERCCGDCPLNGEPCCELAWAQMPYEAEEGGTK